MILYDYISTAVYFNHVGAVTGLLFVAFFVFSLDEDTTAAIIRHTWYDMQRDKERE